MFADIGIKKNIAVDYPKYSGVLGYTISDLLPTDTTTIGQPKREKIIEAEIKKLFDAKFDSRSDSSRTVKSEMLNSFKGFPAAVLSSLKYFLGFTQTVVAEAESKRVEIERSDSLLVDISQAYNLQFKPFEDKKGFFQGSQVYSFSFEDNSAQRYSGKFLVDLQVQKKPIFIFDKTTPYKGTTFVPLIAESDKPPNEFLAVLENKNVDPATLADLRQNLTPATAKK